MRRFLLLIPFCLLAIGCPPPPAPKARTVGVDRGDIAAPLEGKDLDGNVIKLSDYRGKVVVVDFWWTRCGPCIAAIPREKEMVKQLKGRPFAFISVCTSPNREETKQLLKKIPVPWPNIDDGDAGPIVTEWGVRDYPTFVVIDATGVIRYRHYNHDGMEMAVDKWIKEAEKAGIAKN